MTTFTDSITPTTLVGGEYHGIMGCPRIAKRLLCVLHKEHGAQRFAPVLPRSEFTLEGDVTDVDRPLRRDKHDIPTHVYMVGASGKGEWYKLTSVGWPSPSYMRNPVSL